MDILCTISSITKERSSRTESYRNTFKKILKDGQRISLILAIIAVKGGIYIDLIGYLINTTLLLLV